MDQVQTDNKVEEKIAPEQTTAAPQPESDQEINWKKFREAREQERKKAEEVARKAAEKEAEVNALKAAMEAILDKQAPAPKRRDEYDDDDESEEQRIEKKVAAALAKREAEQERQRREREQAEFPQRLVATHKDFNQVCTESNLDYLDYHYPEVSKAFKHMPDGYDKWDAIYSAVKRFVPNIDTRRDAAKAEQNFRKPQSLSSPSVSPGSEAGPAMRLDESRKRANWERMQQVMKGLS